jgi:hypothetical protein
MRLSPFGTSSTIWPIIPAPDDEWGWVWGSGGMIDKGNSEITYPNAVSPTTNPAWPDLSLNPCRRFVVISFRFWCYYNRPLNNCIMRRRSAITEQYSQPMVCFPFHSAESSQLPKHQHQHCPSKREFRNLVTTRSLTWQLVGAVHHVGAEFYVLACGK